MASVTLTMAKERVYITLKGSGDVHIEWGDGTYAKPATPSLSAGGTTYFHTYINPFLAKHTINITTMQNGIITGLNCDCTELTDTLDVSDLKNLKNLFCHNNKLTNLVFGPNLGSLKTVVCYNNRLTRLSVSGLPNLTKLYCYSNLLDNLDVIGLTNLMELNCSYNRLTNLNVSGLSKLIYLDCRGNSLSGVALDSLFKSLNSTMGVAKNLYVRGNSGIANCDVTIATNKGWIVDELARIIMKFDGFDLDKDNRLEIETLKALVPIQNPTEAVDVSKKLVLICVESRLLKILPNSSYSCADLLQRLTTLKQDLKREGRQAIIIEVGLIQNPPVKQDSLTLLALREFFRSIKAAFSNFEGSLLIGSFPDVAISRMWPAQSTSENGRDRYHVGLSPCAQIGFDMQQYMVLSHKITWETT
jgi:hypothetical protein